MEPNDTLQKRRYQHEQIETESGQDPFEQDAEFSTDLTESTAASHGNTTAEADEEYAAELAPTPVFAANDRRVLPHEADDAAGDTKDRSQQAGMIGWIALILGIASLFFWQPVLGPASIITGIFAWVRGSRALGAWSIVLGLIALAAYFVLVPNYS